MLYSNTLEIKQQACIIVVVLSYYGDYITNFHFTAGVRAYFCSWK